MAQKEGVRALSSVFRHNKYEHNVQRKLETLSAFMRHGYEVRKVPLLIYIQVIDTDILLEHMNL